METLRNYFESQSKDIEVDLDGMFKAVSSSLKEYHLRGESPVINSDNIFINNGGYSFDETKNVENLFETVNEDNCTLTRLLVGAYISYKSDRGFVDFSSYTDVTFPSLDSDVMPYQSIREYASALYNDEYPGYYSDYAKDNAVSQSNTFGAQAVARTLTNGKEGACGFDYKQAGNVTPILYPLLIGLSLAATLSIYLIFKYL